jgi:hypothetical protein
VRNPSIVVVEHTIPAVDHVWLDLPKISMLTHPPCKCLQGRKRKHMQANYSVVALMEGLFIEGEANDGVPIGT